MFDLKDKKKMDLDSLDELIGKCEDSMISPFKKKKSVAVLEIDPEGDASDHDQPQGDEESRFKEKSEGDDKSKPDFSEMDLEDLLRMYQEMKDSKGD